MSFKARIKLLFVLILILLFFASIRFYIREYPGKLTEVEIKTSGPLHYITRQDIVKLVTPYRKSNWFWLNVGDLADALEAYPGIQSVSVMKKWPHTLLIQLTEAPALAFWQSSANVLLQKGDIIHPKVLSHALFLPLFIGDRQDRVQIKKMYDDLQKLALEKALSIVKISYLSGEWQVSLSNGIQVILGRKNIRKKFSELLHHFDEISLSDSGKNHAKAKPCQIDMRYRNGFAVNCAKNK